MKTIMKTALSLLVVVAVAFTLFGCCNSGSTSGSASSYTDARSECREYCGTMCKSIEVTYNITYGTYTCDCNGL